MKRYVLILLSVVLVLFFSSCSINSNLSDSVKIESKEYKRAFIGELYPMNDTVAYGVK